MKILLVGEYSNVHATLAQGLRALGHQVCVISNGDFWKNYPRDIDVARPDGRWGGIRLMLRLLTLLPKMRGYDVVQLINPMFFELKAERLFFFYNYLRRHNRRVILGAFGMDYYWVHDCTYLKPLRYSDFNFGDTVRTDPCATREQQDWMGTAKERLNRMIAADCDAIVTGLYEYHVCYEPHFPDKTHFIPFPIESEYTPSSIDSEDIHSSIDSDAECNNLPKPEPLKLFIGISKGRSEYQGTDIMLRAAEDICRQYPDKVQLLKAEGLPFADYEKMLLGADVLLDQLYSYTPAMNALLAMSKGIVVVGGGEPEHYALLHETELRPIVNVQPNYESVYHELQQLVLHPERVPELKKQSIKYIRRHHDSVKVAAEYLEVYGLSPAG